jgi:hypothetical protein
LSFTKLKAMKKIIFTSVLSAAISLSLVCCAGKKEKDNKNADTPAATTPDAGKEASADKKGMTVAEVTAMLEKDEANIGKEVTVSACSWGSNERTDDKIQLNLGDKKLEGLKPANFSCLFSKEQTAAIKAIAKDAMVTVRGKIAKGYGGVELNDCKLVQ